MVFAEAVIICFKNSLADYVSRLSFFCGPLDELIVDQRGVDFVGYCITDVLSKASNGSHVHESPHRVQVQQEALS